VFDDLEARFPGVRARVLNSAAVTVNLDYVDLDLDPEETEETEARDGKGEGMGMDLVIQSGDEVGVIPPVSSG